MRVKPAGAGTASSAARRSRWASRASAPAMYGEVVERRRPEVVKIVPETKWDEVTSNDFVHVVPPTGGGRSGRSRFGGSVTPPIGRSGDEVGRSRFVGFVRLAVGPQRPVQDSPARAVLSADELL